MVGRERLAGVAKPFSRIAMGTVRVLPEVWDAYLERGGATFDTARHYGDASERELGATLERHGVREHVAVVGKGAHTPECSPEFVAPHLGRSLELLRTDYLDLYLLHRDDPEVPVSEWADALAEQLAAGRVRAIGASNWSPERVERFNSEATRRAMPRFAAVSNQLSLAEMLEPVWAGCLRADTSWHERTQMPLLAWSAQARGFFARRRRDREMRRSWASPANRARRRTAEEIAAARAVPAVAVALAWLLARPFPSFAVIGPRSVRELDACLLADDLPLTPDELGRLEG